jgi:hypothetical protein
LYKKVKFLKFIIYTKVFRFANKYTKILFLVFLQQNIDVRI